MILAGDEHSVPKRQQQFYLRTTRFLVRWELDENAKTFSLSTDILHQSGKSSPSSGSNFLHGRNVIIRVKRMSLFLPDGASYGIEGKS
jgi:hypothetical protein